jgi:hypothetical protein
MRLHEPSGYSRTSPTARICEHLEDHGKASLTAPPLDLHTLFDLPHTRFPARPAPKPVPLTSTFVPTAQAVNDSITIFLPLVVNGVPVMSRNKKTGELKPVKFPVTIDSCAVTVTLERGSFVLTATSRGGNIHDSRDDSRRPLAMLRADLRRLLPEDAERLAARLAAVLPPVREKKARPCQPLSAPDLERARKRQADRAASDALAAAKRHKPAPEQPAPDCRNMTPRQFASFKAATLRDSAQAMDWINLDDRYLRS